MPKVWMKRRDGSPRSLACPALKTFSHACAPEIQGALLEAENSPLVYVLHPEARLRDFVIDYTAGAVKP